jgi:predicted DNA-binding transcriptional regulator YafY
MPSNKNAVIRYMYLDQLLSDRNNTYTCLDLLKRVNTRLRDAGFPTIGGESGDYDLCLKSGKRVIQMDMQALQDAPFNMVIDSSQKRYGAPIYRYADQTQSLFSKQLSDDEKRLLQEVLNTLGQFTGLHNFEWLHDLQEKLNDKKAFGRNEYDAEMPDVRKIISFSSNEFLKGKELLGELFSFISHKKVIDVHYEPFGEDPITIRFFPYLLKQYNDRWYLIGAPQDTEKYPYHLVNLPLDRICGTSVVDGVDYVECEDDLEERYDDIIGITYYDSVPLTQILLAVKKSYASYIDTKPIHSSQARLNEEEQAMCHEKYRAFGDYTFYRLEVKPNRELYNTIYHSGDAVILISPKEIREKMIQELSSSLDKLKSVSLHPQT